MSEQQITPSLQDLARAVAALRQDPRFSEELASLRVRVQDAVDPELSNRDLLHALEALEIEPAEVGDELRMGHLPTLEKIKAALRQIQELTEVLTGAFDFLDYAFSSQGRLERAIRAADPEPGEYKGTWVLRRIADAVASFPRRSQWLAAVDQALVADRLRRILEDLVEVRRQVEVRRHT